MLHCGLLPCLSHQGKDSQRLTVLKQHLDLSRLDLADTFHSILLDDLPAWKGAARACSVMCREACWANWWSWHPGRAGPAVQTWVAPFLGAACCSSRASSTRPAGHSTCRLTLKPRTFEGQSETEAAMRAGLSCPVWALLNCASSVRDSWGCCEQNIASPPVHASHLCRPSGWKALASWYPPADFSFISFHPNSPCEAVSAPV